MPYRRPGCCRRRAPGAESSEEPHGVATKSGKHVLPYSVLQEARTDAQSARQRAETAEREAEELRRKVAELTAGGTQTQQAAAMANELSDEEISAAEYDAPLVAKMARQIKALQAAQTAAPAAPAEQDTQDAQDDQRAQVHAALSQRPFLTQLQSAGGIRWARACEIDAELRNNPGYANRGDPVARFADVEARIAAELGGHRSSLAHAIQVPGRSSCPENQSRLWGLARRFPGNWANTVANRDRVRTAVHRSAAARPAAMSNQSW